MWRICSDLILAPSSSSQVTASTLLESTPRISAVWCRSRGPKKCPRLAAKGSTLDRIRSIAGDIRNAVSIGSSATGQGTLVINIGDLLQAGDAQSEP